MRCRSCNDEYEDHVRICAECGSELVPNDAPTPVVEPQADARLGRFHPAAADSVLRLLQQRQIVHRVVPHDDEVEIDVDPVYRDDLRAELTLRWSEILRLVDEDRQIEVQSKGGSAPGWYDAPHGGYVDRAGRLVVADENEDQATDESRMLGPTMLTSGAILAIAGWYLVDSAALLVIGLGLIVLGLFTPR